MLLRANDAGLCGLVFDARCRYLRSVNICGPKTNKFVELRRLFEEAWETAAWARETKDTLGHRANRPDRRIQAA